MDYIYDYIYDYTQRDTWFLTETSKMEDIETSEAQSASYHRHLPVLLILKLSHRYHCFIVRSDQITVHLYCVSLRQDHR